MATERESFPPLIWVNGQDRNNVVVLTSEILYLASVKKTGLPAIDLGLEDGRAADTLLPARAWKVPLKDVTRFQVKQVRSKSMFEDWMNKDVTVAYRVGSKERSLKISLASEAIRNEFVQHLNDRVGPWAVSEAVNSPLLVLARYLIIITIFGLLTLLFSWLELTGQLRGKSDRGLFVGYFEACGPWGILVPGVLLCVGILLMVVWQLQTPPIIATYQPTGRGHS